MKEQYEAKLTGNLVLGNWAKGQSGVATPDDDVESKLVKGDRLGERLGGVGGMEAAQFKDEKKSSKFSCCELCKCGDGGANRKKSGDAAALWSRYDPDSEVLEI